MFAGQIGETETNVRKLNGTDEVREAHLRANSCWCNVGWPAALVLWMHQLFGLYHYLSRLKAATATSVDQARPTRRKVRTTVFAYLVHRGSVARPVKPTCEFFVRETFSARLVGNT